MSVVKRIKNGDTVKVISGDHKGTTAKVIGVLTKKQAVLLEGIGQRHRRVKPTQLNPYGGHRDIHIPMPLHKVAVVTDEKPTKAKKENK